MKCDGEGEGKSRGWEGKGRGNQARKNTMEGRSLRSMLELFKVHQPLLQCE